MDVDRHGSVAEMIVDLLADASEEGLVVIQKNGTIQIVDEGK